jgi:hypothetical protein
MRRKQDGVSLYQREPEPRSMALLWSRAVMLPPPLVQGRPADEVGRDGAADWGRDWAAAADACAASWAKTPPEKMPWSMFLGLDAALDAGGAELSLKML